MKPRTLLALCLTLALPCLAAREARPQRDPFWPIGYAPPKPEPESPPEPAVNVVATKKTEPPKPPKPPPPRPISPAEWLAARDRLAISGVTRATDQASGTTRAMVMINRSFYAHGDLLCITNANVRFEWRVKVLENLKQELEPTTAQRLE